MMDLLVAKQCLFIDVRIASKSMHEDFKSGHAGLEISKWIWCSSWECHPIIDFHKRWLLWLDVFLDEFGPEF